jgi:hypothetical protein
MRGSRTPRKTVVRLPAWWNVRSLSRAGSDSFDSFHLQEAATRSVQSRDANSSLKARLNLLWGMALLGLLLLSSEYRSGDEIAHGHSLIQLWVDAGDGTVHHAHELYRAPEPGSSPATSWFEPLVGDAGSAGSVGLNDKRPDIAGHQDSGPTASGFHLLLMMATVFLVPGQRLMPTVRCDRSSAGLSPRIILSPPRWTPHAA